MVIFPPMGGGCQVAAGQCLCVEPCMSLSSCNYAPVCGPANILIWSTWYTSSIWIWSTWYTSNILIWSKWYTSNILIWSKWYTSNVLPGWTLLFRQTVLFLTSRRRWSHPKLGRLYTCLSVKYKYRNRRINHQKYLIMISGILSRFLRASKMKHKSECIKYKYIKWNYIYITYFV